MPAEVLPAAIAAASGLLGVAVGGWITAHNQKNERRQRRINEQLAEFYSPMLSLHAKIRATSEVRRKVSGAAESAWQKMASYTTEAGMERVEKLTKERWPAFERIIDRGNRQFTDEIIPAYRKMVDLFISKMHLAEASTIRYFPALLEYVEIWNQCLDKSLPVEVLGQLNHSEEKLLPFYQDLVDTFSRLQHDLKEKRAGRDAAVAFPGPALGVNPFAISNSKSETQ